MVKRCLWEKGICAPWRVEGVPLLRVISVVRDWFEHQPEEKKLQIRELQRTPLEEKGWQAKLISSDDGLFTVGVGLTGYDLRFAFVYKSWRFITSYLFLCGLATKSTDFVSEEVWKLLFQEWLTGWRIACCAHLFRKAEDLEKRSARLLDKAEEPVEETPVPRELVKVNRDLKALIKELAKAIRDLKILIAGRRTGKWPPTEEFLEIVQRHNLPRFDDLKHIFETPYKYGDRLSFLPIIFEKLERDFTEVFKQQPLILLGKDFTDEEILAQMEIWAYRKGKEVDWKHLYSYLRKRTGNDDDLLQEAVLHVQKRWRAPGSWLSFRKYCNRVVIGKKMEMEGEKTGLRLDEKFLEFPCTPYKASLILFQEFDKPFEAVKKWLYRNMEKGIIPGCSRGFNSFDDGKIKPKKFYFLEEEGFQVARKLLQEKCAKEKTKKKHRCIIEYLMESRGISRKGAWVWLKRRLKKGKTLEEIYQETIEQSGATRQKVKEGQESAVGNAKN